MKIPMTIIGIGLTAILGLQTWLILAIIQLQNQQAATGATLQIILKKITL